MKGWFNFCLYIPQRDVRKLIYAKLTVYERHIAEIAHFGSSRVYRVNELADYAACKGYIGLLKWSKINGYYICRETCHYAIRCGHLNIVQWIYKLHVLPYWVWDAEMTRICALNGHLHILKWLVNELKCPVNERSMSSAASEGHLKIIQWLRLEQNCAWDHYTRKCALVRGHLAVVQWVTDNGCSEH